MRLREFENLLTTSSYTGWYTTNGTYNYNYTYHYDKVIQRKKMLDIQTPKFKERLAKGEIFNNPLTLTSVLMTSAPARMRRTGTKKGANVAQEHGFVGNKADDITVCVPLDDSSRQTRYEAWQSYIEPAISQSYANVNLSEIQILASLGEMPETLKWIASILQRSINLIKSFRSKKAASKLISSLNKRVDSKGGILNLIADPWLEFRYAIRPLVFEMEQATAALKAQIEAKRQTARGFSRVVDTSFTRTLTGSATDVQWYVEESTVSSLNVRAGVLYDICKDIDGISAIWGLDQPLESVWELVPFSFIIDWFFNVGDVISSWSINPSLRPLTNWVTVHEKISVKRRLTGGINRDLSTNWTSFSWTDGKYELVRELKERFPCPERPILPAWKVKLDVGKITDLVTIASKIFYSR